MNLPIIVPSVSLRRWRALLSRDLVPETRASLPPDTRAVEPVDTNFGLGRKRGRHPRHGKEDERKAVDPFDVSDLVIPSTSGLVDIELARGVEAWKDLESRRIYSGRGRKLQCRAQNKRPDDQGGIEASREGTAIGAGTGRGDDEDDESEYSGPDELGGDYAGVVTGAYEGRIRLPEGFDVACRFGPPTEDKIASTRHLRSGVVSLLDPTKQLDYETELWEVFESLRTESELEVEAIESAICKSSLESAKEVEEGLLEYTRLDGHGLGRLRLRDRHGVPSHVNIHPIAAQSLEIIPGKQQIVRLPQGRRLHNPEGTIIRIEFWRRRLKGGQSPDSNRLEMEFYGEQTLLDVHRAIIDHSRGALSDDDRMVEVSGMFFVEDTFYIAGDTDYSGPIREWLGNEAVAGGDLRGGRGGNLENTERKFLQNKRKRSRICSEAKGKKIKKGEEVDPIPSLRRNYLGIPQSSPLLSVPMSQVRLLDLSFRLGVRYVHIQNGDCETALFFVDVRTRPHSMSPCMRQSPLVLDVWAPPRQKPSPECAACGVCPPVVITQADIMTDGGPTSLCWKCLHGLEYANRRDGLDDGKVGDVSGRSFRMYPIEASQEAIERRERSNAPFDGGR